MFYDADLPADTQIVVTIDGNLLRNLEGGGVDVNGNGQKGGLRTIPFRTVSLASVEGTRVCGRVLAAAPTGSSEEPLVDVTLSVDGAASTFNATTDTAGNFCLDPAPSTPFFGRVDGRTTTNSVPAGAYYPEVVESWQPVAGEMAHVGEIYLPLIAADALEPVSDVADTVVNLPASVLAGSPELTGMEITVTAGSLFADDGTVGGRVGLATVPIDRLPAPLPEGLEPPLVVTVQTDGATNFDVPAAVCFPNLPDAETGQPLAPGTPQALMSYDHDAGRWRPVGMMTVTADGSQICSDPGSGILAPGWHCPCPPPIDSPPIPRPKPEPPPSPPNPNPPETPDTPPAQPSPEPDEPDPCAVGGTVCNFACGALGVGCSAGIAVAGYACASAVATAGGTAPVCVLTGIGGGLICGAATLSCGLLCELACPNRQPLLTAPLWKGATGDPTVDQLLSISDEISDLVYPFQIRRESLTPEAQATLTALLDQANVLAGGNAEGFLSDFAAAEHQMLEDPERSPGNAPHYPIRFAAEILDGEEILWIRGQTEAYGQYTLFVAPDTQLLQVSFYDRFTGSYGLVHPVTATNGSLELPRFVLLPVDSTFSDFDNDALADVVEAIYGSDPDNPDSDGDGATDGAEVTAGTDPLGRDIQIGEIIAAGIGLPFEIDRYAFPALAGQDVFFDLQSGANNNVSWTLSDARGNVIFDRLLNQDRGAHTLEAGGLYTLLVGDAEDDYTGTYQFQLWNVPPPQTFQIAIGDTVAEGAPGPGAGNIETPGVFDVYSFEATPGQSVFFDLQAGANGKVRWTLSDAGGNVIFDRLLNQDRGTHTLEAGGLYTLRVGDADDDYTGTYQFKLWNVPEPQTFQIAIGDTIADGVPAPGAGHIETPGVLDVYTFDATPGQSVYFDLQDGATGKISWALSDAAGNVIFDRLLNQDRGTHTLVAGGLYTLLIGDPGDDYTGTYQFKLWNAPAPQIFQIAIGDTIADGSPGLGAGNIESPGALDVYAFDAVPGQNVFFDLQAGSAGSAIDWELVDSSGTRVFKRLLNTDARPANAHLGRHLHPHHRRYHQ